MSLLVIFSYIPVLCWDTFLLAEGGLLRRACCWICYKRVFGSCPGKAVSRSELEVDDSISRHSEGWPAKELAR